MNKENNKNFYLLVILVIVTWISNLVIQKTTFDSIIDFHVQPMKIEHEYLKSIMELQVINYELIQECKGEI